MYAQCISRYRTVASTNQVPMSKQPLETYVLPVHSLESDSLQMNILPLDHTNPYDFKQEHRHTYFEIMLIERGGCNQLIDFKQYPGADYSCYLICPRQIHLMNRQTASGTVIQFTEDRIKDPELRVALRQHTCNENAAVLFENRSDIFLELQSLVRLLHTQLERNNATNNQVVTHLLHAFVTSLLEQSYHKESAVPEADKKLLYGFYQLLDTHYTENAGVKFYITQLQTTEKKLSAVTKKHAGWSPLQVIHNRLLLEAKRLLLFQEISHKEIAYQLGFDSPASFSAFIKTKTGFSPSSLTKHLADIHK